MSPNHKVKEVAEELLWNVVCCTMLYPDDYKMEIYIKLLKGNGLLSETNNRRDQEKKHWNNLVLLEVWILTLWETKKKPN